MTSRSAARADRWLALLCLPAVHLGLRAAGAATVRRLLALPSSRRPAPSRREVVDAVERSARLLRVRNCLTRSLTTQAMLRRHGLASELRIGVHRAGDGFAAHAWLEADGEVLNDRASVAESFAAFEPLPGEPAARPMRAG